MNTTAIEKLHADLLTCWNKRDAAGMAALKEGDQSGHQCDTIVSCRAGKRYLEDRAFSKYAGTISWTSGIGGKDDSLAIWHILQLKIDR